MHIKKIILPVLISCASLFAQGQSKDSLEVIAAAEGFLKSFIAFDWTNFRNSFAADATIFFPAWEEGKRRSGKTDIERTWLEAFPEFIDTTKKFEMTINPKDLLVQLYGNTAIVTFHFGETATRISRRTLVFVRQKGGWKIVHLHASNLSGGK